MLAEHFDYGAAFSRNLGWVTEAEQQILRSKRIAIAGLGGVGGSHLLTLTRLGIGSFTIADLDIFEQENFNRQAGASMRHVGREKIDVLEELALDINPELRLVKFSTGVDIENLDAFLDGVDLYVDALDFFAVEIRQAVFAACAQKGIPAITAAPLGMGVAFLAFLPGQMTFEEYFRLEGQPEDEQLLRFLLGLSPAMLQVSYLVDDTRLDLNAHKGPSTPMACELCAGMAGTHALKILLNRGVVPAAPRGLHFDAYRNKTAKTWRPMGNNNPIQRLGLKIARKCLSSRLVTTAERTERSPSSPIEKILDYARWAPSGDNTQPWQFEILSDRSFVIHTRDTRVWCVYDLAGRASQTSVGMLLENIAIAARGEGLEASFTLQDPVPDSHPIINVQLIVRSQPSQESPLLPYIKTRSVQRRALSTRPLLEGHKQALEDTIGSGYRLIWLEGRQKKWQITRLLWRAANIRLTIPEVYEVHKKIIHWDAQFSTDRIPDQALGADALTVKMMKWALQSWSRVKMLNRYFAGTLMPRLQLDLIPAQRCAAHFIVVADKPREQTADYLEGGRATQRFWLTSTRLGLQLQPEMTPLIFSTYAREGRRFTSSTDKLAEADTLRLELDVLTGGEVDAVFMGRLGFGSAATSRSLRKNIQQLNQREP